MPDYKDALYYNPHIWWDPIGPPWETPQFDAGTQKQLALVRLSYHEELLAAQTRAVQAARAVIEETSS